VNRRSFALPLAALLAATAVSARPRPPSTEWKERVPADEEERFDSYLAEIKRLQDRNAADQGDGVIRRGFHAKIHAGLKARLTVDPDLPPHAAQGLFAQAGTYEAVVRLSNGLGTIGSDRAPDVRGFAVKVLGVEGDVLAEDPDRGGVQDLIMINHPYLPIRDIQQLMALVTALNDGSNLVWKLPRILGVRGAYRATKFAATRLRRKTRSLLTEDYYSTLPVKWGDYAVKYRLRPHSTGEQSPPKDPNYLGQDLRDRLAAAPAAFDVMVQFYTRDRDTPIEDAGINWGEDDSPWVKVGRLDLPQQDVSAPEGQAFSAEVNALQFNPWHALPAHRPLGSLMRARLKVYRASAAYRLGAGEGSAE
jgi:hypothetical protein